MNPTPNQAVNDEKESQLRQKILQMTSAWLTKVIASDKFLKLLGSSLNASLFASHIVVLVYDRDRQSYFIKMFAGSRKMPKELVRLSESSALIKDLTINLKIEKCGESARSEMRRFGAEMCFPIFVQDELTGILLVGPRLDGKKHNKDTIRFFHTLTNEIGVQFHKECLYLSSITDPLTGLHNRKHLESSLLDIFTGKMKLSSGRVALALLDVDHFKLINDRLGHQAGDEVLKVLAQKVKNSVRSTDLCFRYGGEEFCILFCDLVRRDGTVLESTSEGYADTIMRVIERLKDSIGESTVCWKGHEIKVTASIGVSFLSIGSKQYTVDSLITEADNMLYTAKRAGRNQISIVKNF